MDVLLVQGSDEHGAVSSFPVGIGRLPDGWTSLTVPRSKRQRHLQVPFVPGQERWMRSGRSSQGGQSAIFLKEHDGDCHSIHDVVGYDGWDTCVLGSLTMTQCMCMADSVVGQITWTFLGSGSVEIALRRDVGQSGEIATGVVRLDQTILQLLLLGMLERVKGGTRAL